MDLILRPSRPIKGTFSVPGDKSISHRALMIAAISKGTSVINGLSSAVDVHSTLRCLMELGVIFSQGSEQIVVEGRDRVLREPEGFLNAGNSGTTARLLTGILAAQKFNSTITGDDSLQRRPMKRIIDPLTAMGGLIEGTPAFTPPLRVYGNRTLRGIRFQPPIPSAQVKSCVLLASLFAEGITEVVEPIPTRDHTERMLGLATLVHDGRSVVRVEGGMRLEGRRFEIPGDISSAAFLIVAATLVPGSEIRIQHVGLNPGRIRFLQLLNDAGANVRIEFEKEVNGEPIGNIVVKWSELTGGIRIGPTLVPDVIDEIPILAIAGLWCEEGFEVRGAGELRVKESDRLAALVHNLRAIGADVEQYDDGFSVGRSRPLVGTALESFGDHRIALSFGVAALRIPGETVLKEAETASISFPEFWEMILPFQP
jgi:3-phosphoshikimate 1-carboxyvinyltransferase